MRTIVFLAVTIVWVISAMADILLPGFEMPAFIHVTMGGVVGYFVSDRIKTKKE